MFFGCLSVKSVNLGLYVLQGLDSFVTLVNVCCLILPYNFIYSLYISVGSNGNYMGFDEIVCHFYYLLFWGDENEFYAFDLLKL